MPVVWKLSRCVVFRILTNNQTDKKNKGGGGDTFTETNKQRRDMSGASNNSIESSFWSNQGQAILAQTSGVEASVGAATSQAEQWRT